ncbi:MAG: VCBS repeat-containing protein [Pyrinomonadaceae bacterium]|nr:VCBS repeat-containing protein [Pyrinomonadaceae bacterium]
MKIESQLFRLPIFVLVLTLVFAALPKTKAAAAIGKDAPDTVFSNTAPITINTAAPLAAPTKATVYPSTINVSGMTGTISRVEVSLRGLAHTRISDLDFLLVGPGGQKFIFLSDVNNQSATRAQDDVYTFGDDAPAQPNNFTPLRPGYYKPVNFDTTTDVFPAPAPAAPYSSTTFAANFNGSSPNGVWSLFVVDDALDDNGSIGSGWELSVTTTGAAQTFANPTYLGFEEMITRAAPYSSNINVAGQSGVITNLRVSLNGLSHTQTQDVDVLLVSPNGSGVVLMADTGSSGASSVNLTFDDAATANLPSPFVAAIVSGTYKPSVTFGSSFYLFPLPAPSGPYSNLLSSFKNFSPNGNWQLYVVDDNGNNAGTISGGWSLDIATAPPVPQSGGCAVPSLVPSQFNVGANPTNLAAGDFNNDSKADLVVVNQLSNDVSILLNNGSGGFLPQTNILSGGTNPYAVAVGLFNADNNLDFAVVNSGSNNVSIFLGSGGGTFSAPTNFTTGASPISIAVADFNNDSRQDLAVANFGGFFAGTISILNGNGSGGFSQPSTLRTSTQPAFVKTARLNNDNNDDLVIANFGANSITVYFGNGNGTFGLNQTLISNGLNLLGPVAVELANVSGDSSLDLIVANYNGNNLALFTGSANGSFTYFNLQAVGQNPISVVAADVLGNGINRVFAALSSGNQISTAFNGTPESYPVDLYPNAVIKGDFNGDGKPDLATANSGSNSVTVLTNTCIAAVGNIFDFTGDRRTDVGVYRPSGGLWAVIAPISQYYFGRDRDVIVPADYDGDNRTDFAVFRPETGIWIVQKVSSLGQGTNLYNLQFGLPTDIPAPADYDGDGKADIAVFRPSNGFWYIRYSSDNSTQSRQFGQTGDRPVAADYDGDGKTDIAVFRPSNGVWYVSGSTNGFSGTAFGVGTDIAVPADYDGDGKADITVFRPSNGVWYRLNSSNNAFTAQAFGLAGDVPVPGDYEGDGKFDIAVFRPSLSEWYILRSSDGGFQGTRYGISTDIPVPSAYVR